MARPIKKGLDYFNMDVSFYRDIKLRKLIRRKDGKALSVYVVLLAIIYEDGYYINYDEDLPFVLSEILGYEEDTISDIISYCIEVGLFDKQLYEQYNILTSHGIQERYVMVHTQCKHKYRIENTYCLLNTGISSEKTSVSSEETHINSEETLLKHETNDDNSEKTSVSSEFSTESKVKERKEYIDSSLRSESQSSDAPMTVKDDEINFLAFLDFFNRVIQEHHAQIPTITQISQKRQQMLKARAREHGKEALRKAVLNAVAAPFLNGASDKPFVASFDWIFRPLNFVKVLEGNYNHAITNPNSQSYGTDNNNGYRTAEDLRQGAADIISRRAAARQHPKRELPVV